MANNEKPTIMMLHGGGPRASKTHEHFANFLAGNNFSSIVFDHTGWGKTGGDQTQTGLYARIEESLEVAKIFEGKPFVLVAASMAGHVALEILSKLNISHLILIAPAIYADEAVSVNFGPHFSNILKKPDSYKNASVIKNLSSYTGKVFHVIGSEDEIIPQNVTDLYKKNSVKAEKTIFKKIDQAPHALDVWLEKQPEKQADLYLEILEFIQS